jgi:hypothetical protein
VTSTLLVLPGTIHLDSLSPSGIFECQRLSPVQRGAYVTTYTFIALICLCK